MKKTLLHFSFPIAAIVTFITLALLAHARQADQHPAPVASQQHDAQMPASGEVTTREAKTFSGSIVKENGELVLKDPVTKVSYKLSDAAKARQHQGKRVKVTGKLDMNSNTILVESIVPLS